MLTYNLNQSGVPLYEQLYRAIREDILSGDLKAGAKLPSKRTLGEHLKISKVTVETAYQQLMAEGYLRSREKVGYFVEEVAGVTVRPLEPEPREAELQPLDYPVDLRSNRLPKKAFPFSVWTRLLREVILDYGDELLQPLPICGALVLRQAIARHLQQYRSMNVSPWQILVGAGADFLYNLLPQLLGREKVYGVEDPGYGKIRQVYEAAGIHTIPVPLDADGVILSALDRADVLHLSPSHHFPTGIVTPIARRQALIAWAQERPGRYIIEDDYDSEFRLTGRPIPTMQSIDHSGRVIYLNSFTKSIGPSIRISYAVLPPELMERFSGELGFYACTVPSFEQYTLARFLSRGFFEKHLSRMKKYYRLQRDALIQSLNRAAFRHRIQILEADSGLHFLLRVRTEQTDEELKALCAQAGVAISCLSDYCRSPGSEDQHCLVVSYSGLGILDPRQLDRVCQLVWEAWGRETSF